MKTLLALLPGLEPRSLRYRALAVVTLIVVLPLLWVWTTGPFEQSLVLTLRSTLREALDAARESSDPAELARIARRHRIRLRILDEAGEVAIDHDNAARPAVIAAVEDPFFGPGGAPTLAEYDASMPPLAERPLVAHASGTPKARCDVVEQGLLLVCAAAARRPDGSTVHVMRGSTRLVRSLYEERWQLTAVTLIVLAIGVVVAGWLSWRMVGPIEQLRDEMIARTEGHVSTEPIEMDRSDEFGQLASAFNALLRALDDRNRANAEFAADLAHELKNPVAAVQAAAEALESGPPVEGERRERLHRVLSASSSRLQDVIGRFLDLARAEAGLPDAEREPADLRALADAVIAVYRADERHEGVSFEVEGPSVVVRVVPERLETALHNLVSNAVAFTPEGGRVTVTVQSTHRYAQIRVRDTGPGIAADMRQRIFDRYVTTREGGTGLGLALTRAIVQAHGGTIGVEDPVQGSGTVMVVSLPR